MTKLIAANWKMNHSFDTVDQWLTSFFKAYSDNYDTIKKLEIALCPPAVFLDYIDSELMEDGFQFLEEVAKKEGRTLEEFSVEEINEIVVSQRPIKLGAQDCHHEKSGSFTGDISAEMVKTLGCKYVIIGHSERRTYHGENSQLIAKKLAAAADQKLIPIFCVGETKEIRESGQHLEFIKKQISESLSADLKFEKLVIAYEPVWSIGTGLVPTPAQVDEMVQTIKNLIKEQFANSVKEVAILYGGSVTSKNSGEILKISDGLLVGKASLDADELVKIAIS